MEKLVYPPTGNIVEVAPELVDTMIQSGFIRANVSASTSTKARASANTPAPAKASTKANTRKRRTTTKKAGSNESKSTEKL